MVRVHTFSLKGGEKRGQPNFGSKQWEVTLTGELEPGETVLDAGRSLKRDVKESLGLAWASDPVVDGRPRTTAQQRKALEDLLHRIHAVPVGKRGSALEDAAKIAQAVHFADEAEAAIKTLQGLLGAK